MLFLQILAALAILSILFFKFAVVVFKREYKEPVKFAAPWSLALAFLILCLFLIVAPAIGRIAAAPFKNYLPDLDAEYAAQTSRLDAESQAQPSKETNETPDAAEETATIDDDARLESPQEDDIKETAERQESEERQESDVSDETVDLDQVQQTPSGAQEEEIIVELPQNPSEENTEAPGANPRISTQHPVARMLIRSYKTKYFNLVVALFIISVVIFAPIAEEFVFRVVIQGFFEKRAGFGRLRGDVTSTPIIESYGRELVRSRIALVCVSQATIFAFLHIGAPETAENYIPLNASLNAMIASVISALIIVVAGFAILKRYDAKPGDLGLGETFSLRRDKIKGEAARLGKEWFRGVALQIYATPAIMFVNGLMNAVFPDTIVAPIPIFFFAVYEGFVYFRTRSYATVVGMHMTLNFVSFTTLYCQIILNAY